MQEKDQELMGRYIYQVVRRVPKEQRKDITMELEELIGDMYDSKEETMEQILGRLGDPKEFAMKYQNHKKYLIGPEYYENYYCILKLVLLWVGVASFFSGIISYEYANFGLLDYIIELLVNTMVNITGAFGIVTIVFAVLEHRQVKIEERKEEGWLSTHLTPVPDKKAMISRGETLVDIIVLLVLCTMLIFTPRLFGAYVFEDHQLVGSIPFFNMDQWGIICPVLLTAFIVGFIDEVIKLMTGCYCKAVLLSNCITGGIQLILYTTLFQFFPIWNPNFVRDVEATFGYEITSRGDLLYYWGTDVISGVILAIIYGITILEMGITVYKTIKYSNQ